VAKTYAELSIQLVENFSRVFPLPRIHGVQKRTWVNRADVSPRYQPFTFERWRTRQDMTAGQRPG
jgi:hypothetical protein